MPRRAICLLLSVALGLSVEAQTTTTYSYDNYGQLVGSIRSTGNSTRVRYDYDLAGNRTRVKKGVSAVSAEYDWIWVQIETIGVGWILDPLQNDIDDDLPNDTLTITGLSGTDSQWASIVGGGTHIGFYENDTGGFYSFTYTVQDMFGHSDTATIDLYVTWP